MKSTSHRYGNLQEQTTKSVKHTRLETDKDFEQHYSYGNPLGKGSFGTVTETFRKHDDRKLAVKVINKEKAGSAAVKLLEREVAIMKKVNHKHIISLEEVFETSNKMFLVMEICTRGGLEELLDKKGFFNEQEGRCMFHQLADAVAYIHQNDIVHRDLKLENILLADPEAGSLFNIKLTDFGLSYTRGGSGSDYMMNQVVGTPVYMAPEVITNYGYSQQCDIWSIGVILYKILSGDTPFLATTEEELFDLIKKGELNFPSSKWEHVSQSAKHMLECMMKVDPAHRMTSKEILQHPWIKGEANGMVTTNVLEMMKQYNLEQKQLAMQKKDEVEDSPSQEDVLVSIETKQEHDLTEKKSDRSIKQTSTTKRISLDSASSSRNDDNNNASIKSDKKAASKKYSLPSYMNPTKSSKATKNPNVKPKTVTTSSSTRRKKESTSS